MSAEREKTGVFIGAHAVNPMTNERIPIWIADYVLPGYGTGAIMAVPAHDERDFAFAASATTCRSATSWRRHPAELPEDEAFVAHTADEVLVDSGEFTGMPAGEAIGAITQQLEDTGLGRRAVTYRLARLAGQPPALLGRPDPDRLLRGARRRSRCPTTSCRCCCPRTSTSRRPACGRCSRHAECLAATLPGLRCARAARDRHPRHVRRLDLVFPALLLAARRPARVGPRAGGPVDADAHLHRRRGACACCTSSTSASS